ncbi:MAG: diadenylate cyclase [Bacteroidia bacterium]|nr:diadenylate cyclase [Bacteroidia bacterium]
MILLFKIGFIEVWLTDLADILLASVLFYQLYLQLRGKVTRQLMAGVLGLLVTYWLVNALKMRLTGTILNQVINLGALALVIIFAPEIRKMLLSLTQHSLLGRMFSPARDTQMQPAIMDEITDGLRSICAAGNGALIVVAGDDNLDDIIETGDRLDANITARLMYALFQKESPLHDGAMVIRGDKIIAVRCILPVSKSPNLGPELGLRHRSAVGLAEICDALVVVVSEERKELSIVQGETLRRGLDYQEVEEALMKHRRQP